MLFWKLFDMYLLNITNKHCACLNYVHTSNIVVGSFYADHDNFKLILCYDDPYEALLNSRSLIKEVNIQTASSLLKMLAADEQSTSETWRLRRIGWQSVQMERSFWKFLHPGRNINKVKGITSDHIKALHWQWRSRIVKMLNFTEHEDARICNVQWFS